MIKDRMDLIPTVDGAFIVSAKDYLVFVLLGLSPGLFSVANRWATKRIRQVKKY